MNRKQWFILGIFFIIAGSSFSTIDKFYNIPCQSSYGIDPATSYEVQSCVMSEIYEPFILLLYSLGVIFIICGFLEPKKEEKLDEQVEILRNAFVEYDKRLAFQKLNKNEQKKMYDKEIKNLAKEVIEKAKK